MLSNFRCFTAVVDVVMLYFCCDGILFGDVMLLF